MAEVITIIIDFIIIHLFLCLHGIVTNCYTHDDLYIGGRGMRVVNQEKDLKESFQLASSEAKAAFGDGSVFIERYVSDCV